MASTPLNKTASTHRSTLVRGAHQFHIFGYSERKALAGVSARTSSIVRSGDFEAGECIWALSCCFKKQGLASMSLELVSGKYAATAMASLRIDDPLHRWPAAVWRSPDTKTFPALAATTGKSRGWKLSVPEAFFHGQEERCVVDDRLTILCVVDVLRLDLTPANTRSCFIAAVPPPTISGDLLMLLSASLSKSESVKPCMRPDVTFIVEQIEIRAHKLVLSVRSPVFAAEFRRHMDMDESSSIMRVVHDMSASTFRAMLRFIYTDELPIKPNNNRMILTTEDKHASRRYEDMARDLLVAADRYDLQRLRLLCEKVLAEGMDDKSVIPTLMVVHGRYRCRQLEDSCIEYIASHPNVYSDLKATEEYNEMKNNSCCCSFLVEVTDKVDDMINIMAPNYSSSNNNLQQSHKRKRNDVLPDQVVVHGSHKFTIPYFRAVHI